LNNKDKNKHEMTAGRKDASNFVVSESAGLLAYLFMILPGKSRNHIKSLLKHGQVSVDGTVVTQFDYYIQKGQIVKINPKMHGIDINKGCPQVIYEDEDFIAVNKPAGLVSVSTDNEKINTAYRQVSDYIHQQYQGSKIYILHRLDKDTSGVLLFAKNEKLKTALQENWNGLVHDRGYCAIVEGKLQVKSGEILSWLKQTKTLLMYSSEKAGDGLEAVTLYNVTNENDSFSMLDIHLKTGRKNQIRVHMKDLGHSVAGDKKYGANSNPLKRLGLHAYKLEISHPFNNKTMCFEAPVPKCFTELMTKSNIKQIIQK
jgi:23S rRNA pseudouridine1911/1915/1917 synthase